MSTPTKVFHIRLSQEDADRLERLSDSLPAIQRGVILRLLVSSALEGTLEQQIARVQTQLVDRKAVERATAKPTRQNNAHHR